MRKKLASHRRKRPKTKKHNAIISKIYPLGILVCALLIFLVVGYFFPMSFFSYSAKAKEFYSYLEKKFSSPSQLTGYQKKPPVDLAEKGSGVLLKTKKELEKNSSLFKRPPLFSDCPQDEHSINCLKFIFTLDTDCILAEKLIEDFWQSQGLKMEISAKTNSPSAQALLAIQDEQPLAKVILSTAKNNSKTISPTPRYQNPVFSDAKIAIVIDDLGNNYQDALALAHLKPPIALSILPFQRYSYETLKLAQNWGKPVLLHMPMEPLDYPFTDPGKGALLCSMDKQEIKAHLTKALDSLPGVVGVNNHMGSKFTTEADLMSLSLEEIKARGLFFLDSRTSSYSVGYNLAQNLAVNSCERTVFLDNLQEENAIWAKLLELCAQAEQGEKAIGIGHPYPATIRVLEKRLNELEKRGCQVVSIQEFCH